MFTEKDIEMAEKTQLELKTYARNDFDIELGFHILVVTNFIFLKLAQLENENKRLSDKIENNS